MQLSLELANLVLIINHVGVKLTFYRFKNLRSSNKFGSNFNQFHMILLKEVDVDDQAQTWNRDLGKQLRIGRGNLLGSLSLEISIKVEVDL